jgi:hypothetical protein
MEPERDRESLPAAVDESTEDGPALRDATLTAERIAADEAAATELRDRHLVGPPPIIEPDAAIARHLAQEEQVHGLRRSAILRTPGGDRALGYGGTLYLTSRRLVHLGQVIMTVQLSDIVEASIASERLLLSLNGGEGVTIEVDRPRTFRTEIATAMRALRR